MGMAKDNQAGFVLIWRKNCFCVDKVVIQGVQR